MQSFTMKNISEIIKSHTIKPVTERFTMIDETKKIIQSMTPEFGFNGLGEVVFRRTYSRDNETWNDVVTRVIEGMLSIRKNHFKNNSLGWNDDDWQSRAKNMAISLFNMEWLPPGRGLWLMGTDFVYERGSTALFNCAAIDTNPDIVHAAEWTMDLLMNGCVPPDTDIITQDGIKKIKDVVKQIYLFKKKFKDFR